MSIKGIRTLSIQLQIENKRFLKIPFPVPLFILEDLLDSFLDLLIFACFFIPERPPSQISSGTSIHSIKTLIFAVLQLLGSLNMDEPYDLIDVSADDVQVHIRVR